MRVLVSWVQLLSKKVLVDLAVPEKLRALENCHFSAAYGMEVRNFVDVWDSSRKKLVYHLVGGSAVLVYFCRATIDLPSRRFEFEHTDERNLLVELERIYILVIELDDG